MTNDNPPVSRLRVVCHDLMSLNNIGAIFRAADGAGFCDVILSGICGTPPQRGLVKVSLGAEDHLNWCKVDGVDEVLDLITDDYVICCEQAEGSIAFQDFAFDTATGAQITSGERALTIVMGSEREGVDPRLVARADQVLEIPMRGSKESLNVSVAFALLAYHLTYLLGLDDASQLRGHIEPTQRSIRPGVLTNGITHGHILPLSR